MWNSKAEWSASVLRSECTRKRGGGEEEVFNNAELCEEEQERMWSDYRSGCGWKYIIGGGDVEFKEVS